MEENQREALLLLRANRRGPEEQRVEIKQAQTQAELMCLEECLQDTTYCRKMVNVEIIVT